MRMSLLVSMVAVGACSAEGPASVGDVVQELADPEPAFSIQSARFSNAIGGDPSTISYCGSAPLTACTPTPFAQVRWGVPAYATAQSGLGFDPAASLVLEYEQVFDLGSLTHFNFPTYAGTWASDVTLDLHLRIDPSDASAPLLDEEIHIPFKMNETPNDPATTCPYSPSLTPCSDKITFGTATFNLGAATPTTIYQLAIVGFVDSTSLIPTDGLISEEYASTSAVLRAVLTEECVDTDADSICDEVDACIGDEVACPPDPCPCDAEWANHGDYVSCVAHHTTELVQAGELTNKRRAEIVSSAGQSSCGK
jgi:hypothetical protein